MVSKPIAPPWNDSAKIIVRDQVLRSKRYTYGVMTTRGTNDAISPNAVMEPIYADPGRLAAGIRQNLVVMLRGLRPRGASIYHYFFAPNPLTSRAGRVQRVIAGVKTVHTVCSAPASFANARSLLFADRVITLSRDTERRFIEAGIEPERLRYVPPGIEPLDGPDGPTRERIRSSFGLGNGPMVMFPGDYEFSSASATVAAATPTILKARPDATVIFGCRLKTPRAEAIQESIRAKLADHGDRVRYLNRVEDMPRLLGACDVVVLPAETLFAKMDVPLVLLEAMSQGVPVVIGNRPPLDELLETGGAIAIDPASGSQLAEETLRLLEDRTLREELGAAGAEAVRQKFEAGAMALAVEQIYDELLGE